MGDIWSQDKLVLFLAFFVPGFLAMTLYGLFVPGSTPEFGKRLPEAVGYSALHYACTLWLIAVAPAGPAREAVAYVVVFILPLVWAPLLLVVRDPGRYRPIFSARFLQMMEAPEKTAWDRLFPSEAAPAERWIRITKGVGEKSTVVGGIYTIGSLVSKTPQSRSIFISEQWSFHENGEFREPTGDGILVTVTDDDLVEVMHAENDEQNVER